MREGRSHRKGGDIYYDFNWTLCLFSDCCSRLPSLLLLGNPATPKTDTWYTPASPRCGTTVHVFCHEKFLARRVTIRPAWFFFNPCHTSLYSPSRRENLSLYPPWTPIQRTLLPIPLHPHDHHRRRRASPSFCPLHPSEYHSVNVYLHPFSVSSGETTCPPDETFRMFATSTSRLVRLRFFDLSRSNRAAAGDVDFFARVIVSRRVIFLKKDPAARFLIKALPFRSSVCCGSVY